MRVAFLPTTISHGQSSQSLFPKTYDARLLLRFGEYQLSPLIGIYSDHNIFEPGIEMPPDYISNSINMSIFANISSRCVGHVLGFIWV